MNPEDTPPQDDDLPQDAVSLPVPAAELFQRALQSRVGSSSWEPLSPDKVAALLPQYQVEAILGRGGMGAVYKGIQIGLDRPVAIKLLPAEFAADESFVARFRREARTLAKLQHPGIVAVYDSGQTAEGHLYFIMEFVDGTDLSHVLRTQGLNPEQSLEIVTQVCDALQYAHSLGVLHRDIKPANILLTQKGKAKLADFGLARPVEEQSSALTRSDIVMGTPDYMAPEQMYGQSDHRADLFSLGVMLYEMLTGRTPRGSWLPPSHRVQVDVRLDQVILKALQEEPELRYQQASEMRTDVDVIRNTPPPEPAPKHHGQGSAKPKAKQALVPAQRPPTAQAKGKVPFGLLSALLLVITASAYWVFFKDSQKPAKTGDALLTAKLQEALPASARADTKKPPTPPQWIKVFTNPENIPDGRSRQDGWIAPYRENERPGNGSPFYVHNDKQARNMGLRAKFRLDEVTPASKFSVRGRVNPDTFVGYALEVDLNNAQLFSIPQKDESNARKGATWDRLAERPHPTAMTRGTEITLEMIVVGDRVIGRINGQTVGPVTNDVHREGKFIIISSQPFRDVEVLDLDGLPEAEALRIAGMDGISRNPQPLTAVASNDVPSVTTTNPPANVTPPETQTFGVSRYLYLPGDFTWAAARDKAASMGGHPVIIDTEDENTWIKQTFGPHLKKTNQRIWLGARQESRQATWRWENGENFAFADWLPTDPNPQSDAPYSLCLMKSFKGELGWADDPSTFPGNLIVEWDTAPRAPPQASQPRLAQLEAGSGDPVSPQMKPTSSPTNKLVGQAASPSGNNTWVDFIAEQERMGALPAILEKKGSVWKVKTGGYLIVSKSMRDCALRIICNHSRKDTPLTLHLRNPTTAGWQNGASYRSAWELPSNIRFASGSKGASDLGWKQVYACPDYDINATNTFELRAVGDQIQILFNGRSIASVTDNRITEGYAAYYLPAGTEVTKMEYADFSITPMLASSALKPEPAPTNTPATDPRLAQLEAGFTTRREVDAEKPFAAGRSALDQSYLGALSRARSAAQEKGLLAEITALDAEKQRIESGGSLSVSDDSTLPASLKAMRGTYRQSLTKLETERDAKTAPLFDIYTAALDAYVVELTKADKLPEATRVKQLRDKIAARKPAISATTLTRSSQEPPKPSSVTVSPLTTGAPALDKKQDIAEFVLSLGGSLSVTDRDGNDTFVDDVKKMPKGKYKTTGIYLLRFNVTAPVRITEEMLKFFAREEDLKQLEIRHSDITGAGLASLTKSPDLWNVRLAHGVLTDADLAQLPVLPSMSWLDLGENPLQGAGLAHLSKQPALRGIMLTGAGPTAEGLTQGLAALPSLEKLFLVDMSDTAVAALPVLGKLQALKKLSITNGRWDVRQLPSLPNLQELEFTRNTLLTSADLLQFARFGKLRVLDLSYNGKLDDTGWDSLAAHPALEELVLSNTRLTDASVPTLSTLKKVRKMNLRGTKITSAGLAELKKSLPRCLVEN